MKKYKRMNRSALLAFAFFYVFCVICLFWFHPFVASAAEKVPGGVGNKVIVSSYRLNGIQNKNSEERHHVTMQAADGYEIVAYLSDATSGSGVLYKTIWFYLNDISKGELLLLQKSGLSDYVGAGTRYVDGELSATYSYTMSNIKNFFDYANVSLNDVVMTCSVSGCKIFNDYESLKAYAETGSLNGMLESEEDVDSGEYDSDIGYLHDLKHKALMYGEQDENGLYSSYDDRFTWSDYYPEYDDTYLVEVRASCEVEVRKWFGIGKSTVYNSNIRKLADGVSYKDLEYIVSLSEQNSLFADFINEHMPGNNSVSDVISSASYIFDTYYFRIYRWDEDSESYKYGLWVRLNKEGSALDATLNKTVDAGELDKNGNWKQKTDSDYGEGIKDTTIVGAGATQDDAKFETDQKQEEIDNGGKHLDLSNTSFQELWEWFTGSLLTLWNGLGVIPDFFGRLFSFLPSPIIVFIGLGIVVAIILRVLGR